jgi:hypothetical protein
MKPVLKNTLKLSFHPNIILILNNHFIGKFKNPINILHF